MDQRLERILPRVQKPARYVGGEYNQILKVKSDVRLRMAFCFPDIYEIGMSNIGMRILYHTINQMPGVWCERVFAPWGDMDAEMREAGIPLYALESGDPVSEFDVLGFSMGGAETMVALSEGMKPEGVILVAPAIWGWQAMNPLYKAALWIAAHTVPSRTASGRGLEIYPTDNIDVLRTLSKGMDWYRASITGRYSMCSIPSIVTPVFTQQLLPSEK